MVRVSRLSDSLDSAIALAGSTTAVIDLSPLTAVVFHLTETSTVAPAPTLTGADVPIGVVPSRNCTTTSVAGTPDGLLTAAVSTVCLGAGWDALRCVGVRFGFAPVPCGWTLK